MNAPARAARAAARQPAWGLVGLLAVTHFAAFVDRALPSVVAPLIKAELDLSDAAIGGLQGPAFVGLYVLGLLLAGHLVTRVDPWRVAAACVGCWTLGGAVFALAPNLEGMMLGRLLLGAGQAAFVPAALMLLGSGADPAHRSKSLSMFTTGSATGRSGALLLGGGLLAGLGGATAFGLESWRLACLALIAPNLILAAALLIAGRRAQLSPAQPPGGLGQAAAAARRRPLAYVALAVCGAGGVFLVQAAGAWAPSILNRAHGLTAAEAALAFGLVVLVCAPAGHLAGGWLVSGAAGRRFGPGRILATAVLAAAACAWGLALAPGRVSGLAFLSGLTAGGGLSVVITLITLQELTPVRLKPAMGALFLTITALAGVAGGPWLTGMLSDALAQDGRALAEALALAVAPAAGLVAAVALVADRAWRMGQPTGAAGSDGPPDAPPEAPPEPLATRAATPPAGAPPGPRG